MNNLTITPAGTLTETIAKMQWHLQQLTSLAAVLREKGHPLTLTTWTKSGSPLILFDKPLSSQFKALPKK